MEESRKTWVALETINPKGARTRILFNSRSDAVRIKADLLEAGYKISPVTKITKERPERPKWEQIRAVEILSQLKKLKQKSESEIQK